MKSSAPHESGNKAPQTAPTSSGSWVGRGLSILITLGVALALLAFFQPPTKQRTEDFALGPYTSSYRAEIEGHPIHCSTLPGGPRCVDAAQHRGHKQAVLWLGNSQVHGVNAYAPGQATASVHLFEHFRRQGVEVQTFSQANANLQEHYVLFEWLRPQLPLAGVVVGLCYDDTREGNLRGGISPALDQQPVREGLGTTAFGRALLERHDERATAGDDAAALDGTLQARSEGALTGWLTENSGLWRARMAARSRVYVSLFQLRNATFNITPTSKRPKIPARYRDNLDALSAFLERAQAVKIPVQLYIAPIRNDLPLPYDMDDYRAFKTDTRALADRFGARWTDLEGIVPTADWGEKGTTRLGGGGEVDFMHFKATGHAKLADRLKPLIEALVAPSRPGGAP